MTTNSPSKLKRLTVWLAQQATVVALLIMIGVAFMVGLSMRREQPQAATSQPATATATIWTCSMHPQIRQDEPGKCPICSMNLIPAEDSAGADDSAAPILTVSPAAAALMDIQTSPVERRFVQADVRMVGKIDYDETRMGYITARVAGRLDRLFVDYTGVVVNKGDHLVKLYSPELVETQEQLLISLRAVKEMSDSDFAQSTADAAREKLRLWGLTSEQISDIEKRGSPAEHIEIKAPMGGIVIHKNAQEGMYVKTGTRIYTIADLSKLWVLFDAYESDLTWLHYGQSVQFTTQAHPGETFEGKIAFIDPILDDKRRTAKVRVNVTNEKGQLKPGMFVRGIVKAQIAADGRVMNPSLAGKWISPMHPEIVKDKPGHCDICGMALVRAEDLGYVPASASDDFKPLVVPATAVLITGKRAIAYVKIPGADRPTFEGREVILGPRAGDFYLVRKGLLEGDLVVTHGNFKIDSALQLAARPSMMSATSQPTSQPASQPASQPSEHEGHNHE